MTKRKLTCLAFMLTMLTIPIETQAADFSFHHVQASLTQPVVNIHYIVQPGDTSLTVAQKLHIDPQELISFRLSFLPGQHLELKLTAKQQLVGAIVTKTPYGEPTNPFIGSTWVQPIRPQHISYKKEVLIGSKETLNSFQEKTFETGGYSTELSNRQLNPEGQLNQPPPVPNDPFHRFNNQHGSVAIGQPQEQTPPATYLYQLNQPKYYTYTTPHQPVLQENNQAPLTMFQPASEVINSDPVAAFEYITSQLGLPQEDIDGWAWIITRESNWDPTAMNPSSGAYGLPQSLPGNKMATHGDDWQTNPYTQLLWMYDYMVERYGSVQGAVAFWRTNHWY